MSQDIGVWTGERQKLGIRLLAGTRFVIGMGFAVEAVARNARGKEARPESQEAVAFSLVGAARRVRCVVRELRETPFSEFAAMLRDALNPATQGRPLNVWNDAQTAESMSQELTKAIGRLSQYQSAA